MEKARQADLLHIFRAGLDAVAPDKALLRHMQLLGDRLLVGKSEYNLAQGRVLVLGGGKGAAPMAAALESLLSDLPDFQGLVVVKYDHGLPLKRIRLLEAAHPVPDKAGVEAATAMLALAEQAMAEDLVICLFTGGASALTPALAPGLTLDDLRAVTSRLLECGATIHELNAVRKHLGLFGGGLLARAARPARVLTLLVSDVVGDKLDVIASGPTAPDPSTFARCLEIVDGYGLRDRLPLAVMARLLAGAQGNMAETPKPGDPLFDDVTNVLVATNRQALDAAARAASAFGFEPRILTDTLEGEAREQATLLVAEARRVAEGLQPGERPVCLLAGGETTVTVRGHGKGGRNQEMALAANLALEGENRVSALFGGTDGSDGPTDAAGGFACGTGAARMREIGNPDIDLENNNSYAALDRSGLLLRTGPTLTNVMDLAILVAYPSKIL